MKTFLRLARRLTSAFAAASLAGCAIVDKYSGRAVVYNIEAEQAQDQGILLNIIRAYLRRPMQFTTVSSITGTATATGSLQYSAPVNIPFRPGSIGTSIAQFPAVNTWTSGGTLSGGPTFTIPVLDTQEFYNGILKPIPAQLWNLYTQQGYAQDLLVNLFVEKIVLRKADCDPSDHDRGCEIVLQNYVEDDIEIELFQLFSDYLLQLGLTTEQEKDDPLLRPDKEGCDLTPPDPRQKPAGMSGDRWKEVKPQWAKKWKEVGPQWTKKMQECAETRIWNALNVNLKLSGSLGGLSSGAGASGGGTGGTAASGSDFAPAKFSLCFATPRQQERACVYPRSKCGLKPQDRAVAPGEDDLKGNASACRSLAEKRGREEEKNERSYSEIPLNTRAAAGSTDTQKPMITSENYKISAPQLGETINPPTEPSGGGTGTPNLSAAVFLQARIANKMKARLAALAPEVKPYIRYERLDSVESPIARRAKELIRSACPGELRRVTKVLGDEKQFSTKRVEIRELLGPASRGEMPRGFSGLYCAIDNLTDNWVKVDFHLRSTEGVIYYLGELARRQIRPEFTYHRMIYFNYPRHHLEYEVGRCIDPKPQDPVTDGRPVCRPIFVLERGPVNALQGGFLSTVYEGEVYSVPSDGDSYSTQVLDILKQALALSSSSKSLPQANVVSVVGGQ
jgi:hypothetical protein